jgi:hypothetical protein
MKNQKMLDYCLREVQIGVRMMFRDNQTVHVFDYDRDGKYMFLMAVVPTATAMDLLGKSAKESDPLKD